MWTFTGGAYAQAVSNRGFVEAEGLGFFQAGLDSQQLLGDVLLRDDLIVRPWRWFQLAAGLDLRGSTHNQVEEEWRLDWEDRGVLRPRAAVRRLAVTLSVGPLTVDVGKQLIRWGRADVIYPTDRFAPRDYLNVLDTEVLPVTGVRPSLQLGSETLEFVGVARLTPSRLPLLDRRWTVVPAAIFAAGLTVIDDGSRIEERPQLGFRWRHTGGRLETALSFFDGDNHLPDLETRAVPDSAAIALTRVHPRIRMFGADAAVPTSWLTWKLEAAYVTARDHATEEYVLYVVEVERQIGEWLVDVGYAGDVTTREYPVPSFAPDRLMAKSIIGRVAYTVDPQRTVAIEGAVRQHAEGYFARVEYSQAMGQHWRLTLAGVGIGGEETDFLGRYRENSHASVALRFSF